MMTRWHGRNRRGLTFKINAVLVLHSQVLTIDFEEGRDGGRIATILILGLIHNATATYIHQLDPQRNQLDTQSSAEV